MNIYFISGLGADERAFQRITLPERFVVHHLAWKPPLDDESMNAYARRMAEDIEKESPFSIVGLSLGGMIAVEMNSFLKPVQTNCCPVTLRGTICLFMCNGLAAPVYTG